VLGRYIADFFAAEVALAVEVDGCDHGRLLERLDERRDCWLRRHGYTVLRLSDTLVLSGPPTVAIALIASTSLRSGASAAPARVPLRAGRMDRDWPSCGGDTLRERNVHLSPNSVPFDFREFGSESRWLRRNGAQPLQVS
jgi:hypothetical protein